MSDNLLQYAPDKKIQNYVFSFKAKLGKGAYGTVYLGKKDKTNNVVALKVVDKKLLSTEYAQQLINQEIEIMKKVDNEHVVKLIDVLHSINNTYIITEYCNGGDLREYLKKKRILTEDEALKIIRDVLKGLKVLIEVGIIHRDIKPANILVHDGTFKLTDFGFAREDANHQDSIMNSLVGTPLYMSPQILKRQSYTSKCDIWSVGLILYEMLYGQTPWHSQNLVELMAKLDSKPLVFPTHPKTRDQTKDLLKSCLQLREDQRISWEQLFSHPLINIQSMKIDIPPINNNTMTYFQIQSHRQREAIQLRVKTETRPEHSRERSHSVLDKLNTQVEQTPPLMKQYETQKDSSFNTPSAMNSHSTNTTISSGRPKVSVNQFEVNTFKTQASKTAEIHLGLGDELKHQKQKSIFQDLKIPDSRLKRTSSLCNNVSVANVNYVNYNSQSQNKQILCFIRIMQNQLDLIPNHLDFKKKTFDYIESIKQKLQRDYGLNSMDYMENNQLIQHLVFFLDQNKMDHFVVQVQVMLLLLCCFSHIQSTNQQARYIVLNQTQQENIKRVQHLQQCQLTVQTSELQKEIQTFLGLI